jgi:hypothetical protein
MNFAAFDVPNVLTYAIPAVFWAVVIFQYFDHRKEAQKYLSTEICPRCRKRNIHVEIHLHSEKTNNRVSLIKVGVGFLLISLSIFLLRGFVIILLDLIRETNFTGVQNEDLLGKAGFTSFPLIVGIGCGLYGVSPIIDYFGGKKRKEVSLRCLSCGTEFKPITEKAIKKVERQEVPPSKMSGARILQLVNSLEVVEAPRYFGAGGNYVNDYSPKSQKEVVSKIEQFIGYGGKLEGNRKRIRVAWKSHSEGELLVYRVSKDSYVVHGGIITG